MSRRAIFLLATAWCASCDPAQESAESVVRADPSRTVADPSAPVAPKALAIPQLPRSNDPRFVAALQAFQAGDLARASELRIAAGDHLDVELLGARIAAASGDQISAVRAIEAARARLPDQGRIYATAAEIYAASGRLSSAEDEIRDGLASAGPSPDLTRARGLLALCREGGARKGLEHLLAALQADPELPYCELPLAQAHLLLGNAALAAEQPVDAIGHARAALKAVPDEVDALQLLADAFAAIGEYDQAIELYERLLDGGLDVRGTLASLSLRSATAALLRADGRDAALASYLRARELGLSDSELGFGATALENEARRRLDAGLTAFDEQKLDVARSHFEFALRCAPHSVEAHHHLGVVAFKENRFDDAARHWTVVLDIARRDALDLPDPVHLNLARALFKAGRTSEVRAILEAYLAASPEGEYAAETREMLTRLQSETSAAPVKSN